MTKIKDIDGSVEWCPISGEVCFETVSRTCVLTEDGACMVRTALEDLAGIRRAIQSIDEAGIDTYEQN